jgi:O-6-methylguanine DNA methyltransferase
MKIAIVKSGFRNKKPSSEGDFKKKIISIVSKIKRGETLSYKAVAKKAGNDRAARAVGNILNKYYRECLTAQIKTIPCHRVIRSDGQLGGYAKGKKEKKRLLLKEKSIKKEI